MKKKEKHLAITIKSYEESHLEFIKNTNDMDKFPYLKEELDSFILFRSS